ncbi:MAG TPA: PhzF family phenazine biosynthesis protein [Pseudonocardiaceae bacterium]|nr:PhzF family phenazine biosynthesis protein [Pseudonocardiaceae bacterium]
MTTVAFHHADVFAEGPYSGNSVAVVVDPPPLADEQLAIITRELRHFETIFVSTGTEPVPARVFDLERELAFAGHPVLGAAAVLHDHPDPDATITRSFALPARTVTVRTCGELATGVLATLDQGRPDLVAVPPESARQAIAEAIGLSTDDLDPELPPEIHSTGLRYLVIPVRPGVLARAGIRHDITEFLDGLGAEFAYLLDVAGLEGRHWNNDGVLEDVATGSAAGCVAAFLMRHGLAADGTRMSLRQGQFTGRPARIEITAFGDATSVERVIVSGRVVRVATGRLHALPAHDL